MGIRINSRQAFSVALAVAAGCSIARASLPPPSAAQLLGAYFATEDPLKKEKLLDELLAHDVPKDPAERTRMLREALGRPQRAGAARFTHLWGDPALEGFVATPEGYEAEKTYPTMLAITGYGSNPHANLRAFSLPKEEWDLMRQGVDAPKPAPSIPWEDGLVLAPTIPDMVEEEEATFVVSRARILEAIATANRWYGADPDRVVGAGMSLGAAIVYDVATRHPDRFAGLADVSGGCPLHPTPLENLRPMQVYLMHGDKDSMVPLAFSKDISQTLTRLKIGHELFVVEGGEHSWPTTPELGERVRKFLRERKRDPWPRELPELIFAARKTSYRIWWIELPPWEKHRKIAAFAKDNVITLGLYKGIEKVTLHLGEPLVDLDREVIVRNKEGSVFFRGKVERNFRDLVRDLETDGWDTARAAPCRLEVAITPK